MSSTSSSSNSNHHPGGGASTAANLLANTFQNSLRINENGTGSPTYGSMRVQGQTPPQNVMMRANPSNGKYQPIHYHSLSMGQQPQAMTNHGRMLQAGYGQTYSPTHSISGGSSQHSGSPRTSITSQHLLMAAGGGGGNVGHYGIVPHNGPGHLYENLDYYGVEGG